MESDKGKDRVKTEKRLGVDGEKTEKRLRDGWEKIGRKSGEN